MSSAFRITGALAILVMAGGAARATAQPASAGMPASMIMSGPAATATPPQLDGVTFKQRLNEQLPLDAPFKDEHGQDVTLGQYFGKKPVMLAFVYYSCPMLCMQVIHGVAGSLKAVPFVPGQDFDVVYVSFDPRDTPKDALAKKQAMLEDFHQEAHANGWHFLSTNDEATIKRVTSAVGFFYRWDDRSQQYAHVSGVLVVTPDGKLSRYFYGIEYSPKELRMALVESGKGTIGGAVDELLLYCYHYDPAAGRYGAVPMNIVRLGGAVTVLILGGFIWLALRKESAVAHA